MEAKNTYYSNLALKIVPPSSRRSVNELRSLIATVLEREITNALIKQREEAFPDLLMARSELLEEKAKLVANEVTMKQKYKEKERELEEREYKVTQQEKTVKETAQRLQKLLDTFDAYLAWMDGVGEVDENSKRFAELCDAYRMYKNQELKRK
jgi:hypothetical protein